MTGRTQMCLFHIKNSISDFYSPTLFDKETKRRGYHSVYLKSDLENYYEKFGATFMEVLKNGERLYQIKL